MNFQEPWFFLPGLFIRGQTWPLLYYTLFVSCFLYSCTSFAVCIWQSSKWPAQSTRLQCGIMKEQQLCCLFKIEKHTKMTSDWPNPPRGVRSATGSCCSSSFKNVALLGPRRRKRSEAATATTGSSSTEWSRGQNPWLWTIQTIAGDLRQGFSCDTRLDYSSVLARESPLQRFETFTSHIFSSGPRLTPTLLPQLNRGTLVLYTFWFWYSFLKCAGRQSFFFLRAADA